MRRRQLARLEKLARPYIKSVRHDDAQFKENAGVVRHATWHAINLGALILFGEPEQDEPLSIAWQRCVEGFTYLQRLEKLEDLPEIDYVGCAATVVRRQVLGALPGTTEKAKLQHLLFSAPPWLLWMTCADLTAWLLGLELPDCSSVNGSPRVNRYFIWPALPKGKFESDPVSTGGAEISPRDWLFFKEMKKLPEEEMSRLDRKRFFEIARKLPPVD